MQGRSELRFWSWKPLGSFDNYFYLIFSHNHVKNYDSVTSAAKARGCVNAPGRHLFCVRTIYCICGVLRRALPSTGGMRLYWNNLLLSTLHLGFASWDTEAPTSHVWWWPAYLIQGIFSVKFLPLPVGQGPSLVMLESYVGSPFTQMTWSSCDGKYLVPTVQPANNMVGTIFLFASFEIFPF